MNLIAKTAVIMKPGKAAVIIGGSSATSVLVAALE